MAARRVRPADKRSHRLPGWFVDEAMLRRILMLRAGHKTIREICKVCGFARGSFDRIRKCATHGTYPGEKVAAEAFIARLDALGPRKRWPLLTAEEGKMLAKDIARWKIDETGKLD